MLEETLSTRPEEEGGAGSVATKKTSPSIRLAELLELTIGEPRHSMLRNVSNSCQVYFWESVSWGS